MKQRFFYWLCILSVFILSFQKSFSQKDSGWYASFDSVKIYYEAKGNGFPVVLVHGFIVNGDSWKKTALYNDLVREGYRVITMDLRGNGRSGKPHIDTAYAKDAEAKDIMGLLTYLKIPKYDVIGYSRGSIIVSRLLVLDKRVNKAVMGGMGTDFTDPEWPRRKMFYRALMGDTVKQLEDMVNYVKTSGLDQLALAYQQKYQPSTSVEELSILPNKILVICGDHDEDNGSATRLAFLIPKAYYIQVPGTHNTASQSKDFSAKIIYFLQHDTVGPTP